MKLAKKLATFLLALCLVVPCFSMMSYAADGKLMFTDPSTATGETVEVKGVVEVAAGLSLEDITVNLTYDTTMLRFLNGEGITETEAGKLTFEKLGTENGNRVEYFMYFTALAEGTTTISVADCNVWLTTDEKVYPVLGSSAVTIALGENPVPEDPSEQPADGSEGIEIAISGTTTITLLDEIAHITLPQRYMATTILVNGVEFPAWQDTEKTNLCILYATNSNGETALYQFDSVEGTYQRFEVPEEKVEEPQNQTGDFLATVGALLEGNMSYVVLGAGAAFILFVIIIIILSIKLYNRNAELDELYEEYGLYEDDDDDEEDEKPVKPAKRKEKAVAVKEEIEEEIVFAEPEYFEEVPVKEPELKVVPVEKKVVGPVVKEDEEDDEYFEDDMDFDFEIDFIDLDD